MRKNHRILSFPTFKLHGHDSEQYQEGHTSGMLTRKGTLYIFFHWPDNTLR